MALISFTFISISSCSSSSKYVIFNLPRKTSEQELKDHFKRNNVENVEVQIANNVAVITSMQTCKCSVIFFYSCNMEGWR